MSLDDHEPPVHRISRVEDRQRLLAETLAHVEAQEAQYRLPMEPVVRQPAWKPVVALLLFVVAGALALYPPPLLRGAKRATVTPVDRARGLRAELYLQAQQVEAYRVEEGRLPASLAQVPVRLSHLEYVRSNNRTFQLVGHDPDGTSVVYDSAVPAPEFAAMAASWGVKDAPR